MVNESHVGTEVEYRGAALGKFPPGIDHVAMTLASVCGEAAFLRSTAGFLFGVKLADCRLPTGEPRVSPIAFRSADRDAELDSIDESEGLDSQHVGFANSERRSLHARVVRPLPDTIPEWTIEPVENMVLGVAYSARLRSRPIR